MNTVLEKPLSRHAALLEGIVATLMGCRYFQTMKPAVLRDVLKKGTYLEVPGDTQLIREAALDDDIYFLLDGALKVLSGEKLIIRLNTPGDIVGEFAVVSDSPRSADVVTEGECKLVRISSAVIKRGKSDPARTIQFYTLFSHIMAAKLNETSRRAKLYEDAVLEAREIASSNTRLESEIADKLHEILLYSKVIESSSEAMLVTDMAGRIQRFNPAAARMFPALGKRRRAVLTLNELVKDFDLAEYRDQAPGTEWQGEWTRGGEEDLLVLQASITPVMDSDGTLIGIAHQLRDVSLQKAQERAIAKKNEEIKKTLLDLEATYQELQRSDRLKTETLQVVSNELNGPIRKIIALTGKLAQGYQELSADQVSADLAAVQEQGEYLKIISDNIAYLIDLQAEFSSSGSQTVDLSEVISEVCRDLGFWAGRKAITVDLKLPEEPMTMGADPRQIKVALNLLLEQAMMVSQANSTITVEGQLLPQSQQVHLEVAYNGPSFHHIAPNTGDSQGRMGLLIGLPLARKVISQYQGSLQFLGTHQRARISILLPRTQKEGDERPNRIMIFDEEDMDRLIVRGVIEHLWPDSVVLASHDPFELLDTYEDFRPDLVILDPLITQQPGWANHRLVAALVQHRRHVCPLFALSALYKDFAERTIAVERGVTDFLAKPYSIFDLRFKIKSLLQSHRKEESLHQNMDQAQKQAYTDGLTRLANRKHFDGFLETQINYSRQTKKPCSLILLDIDNFKHYNDTNGHQLGDEILKGVARVLAKSVRSSDLAARYGGEEFVVVLPETRKDMAAVIAEKMRRTIQETEFPKAESQPLGFISASFGVATFDEDAESGESLLKAADECLYRAKHLGRNRVVRAEQRQAPQPASLRQSG
jgi:diguanylate cyclase (GGDEF)-like protein/PAS domain S-box-containing protein